MTGNDCVNDKFMKTCWFCKGIGKNLFTDKDCVQCNGKRFDEYEYPLDAEPDAGCEHNKTTEEWGKIYCADCGMPMGYA